jgi:glutathione S-transferase
MEAAPLKLYTFTLSHYSEKIRWMLELEKIPFEEIPWTPFFHVLSAKRRGKATTVPVLESGAESIQDSTRILLWLEKERAPLSLVPRDPREREAALAAEARFDDVGFHVLRYIYSDALAQDANVIRYWTLDATPVQKRIIERAYPAMRWIFRRRFRVNEATKAKSRALIDGALTWLEGQVTAERPYLVGDRLTVADVTAASLLAPLAAPDEHPVYGTSRYREGLASLMSGLEDRRAIHWVRETYRRHRAEFARDGAIRRAVNAP